MLPLKIKSSDDFQTPPIALTPLLPYIKKDWVVWECANGNGNLEKALKDNGLNVVGTDIKTGFDFVKDKQDFNFDLIITNPPYSLKNEFLKKAYEYGKPFALLLPLTALESKERQSLYEKYGIEILLLNKRINFETPGGKGSSSWFATAWFCWKLLPEKIIFGKI